MNYLYRIVICGLTMMSLMIPDAYSAHQVNTTPVIKGLNEFAFDLFRQVDEKKENKILSPYSLSSLLGILANGAGSETYTQMMGLLHMDESQDMYSLTRELTNLDASLNNVKSCGGWLRCKFSRWFKSDNKARAFIAANALWADESFTYKKSFLTLTENNKGIHFQRVNFIQASEQARKKINRWVEKNTQGYIRELLPAGAVTGYTRLVLTNALYFKGIWEIPFKRDQTQSQPFKLDSGESLSVPMMQQKDKFFYAENDHLQMLELPYAKSTLAMIILLPRAGHSLQDIQQTLNGALFSQLLLESYKQEVMVSLPKFSVESTFNGLGKTLQAMGLTDAFNEKANFSNMTEDTLMISDVIQKAVIKVDEEGTVAAAATATLMAGTAYMPPVVFQADHPFLFVIYDRKSGVLLFMGQVVNPS